MKPHRFPLLLLLVCLFGPGAGALRAYTFQSSIPATQYNALLDLYNSTNGTGWTSKAGWTNGTATSWYGVTVSGVVTDGGGNVIQTGNVISLDLGNNKLTGAIPGSTGNLTGLTLLDLSANNLSGSIPVTLGNLSALQYLYLWGNVLTGSIPSQLGNLASLIELDLSDNQLSSSIPSSLGSLGSLQYLALFINNLNGQIPSSLGNLTSLTILYLDANRLTGSVPAALGNLAQLQELTFYDNQLDGVLPVTLVGLGNLTLLQTENNILNIADPSGTRAVLDAISANGTSVSYSPQGTGYTSYLTRFSDDPISVQTAYGVSFGEPVTLTANRALSGEVAATTSNLSFASSTFSIAAPNGTVTLTAQVDVSGRTVGNQTVDFTASGAAAFTGNYRIVALLGGTVTDNASAAIPGVAITLAAPGGATTNLTTTASGEIVLSANSSRIIPMAETGNWSVAASKPGYKSANGTFAVTGTTATVSLAWVLQTLASPDPATGPSLSSPALTGFLPSITSGLTANGTTGTPFSYNITATNTPDLYTASPLPSGLSINATTGLISGTPTSNGTFNVVLGARNPAGVGSANLTLGIGTPLTGLQQWRQSNFGNSSNTGSGADAADPDKDGKPNLLEYALNTDPLVPEQTRVPTVTTSAGRLTLVFERDTTKTDITFEVQSAADLATWSVIARSTGGAATADVGGLSGGVSETGNGTYRSVSVQDGTLINSGARRQLRLRVSGN